MVPRAPTSNPSQRARHEPLYDVHPRTGASIEVFYADRTLETFGKGGAGWFLVASPARLCARRSADRSVCHVLRSVSPRNGYRRLCLVMHTVALLGPAFTNTISAARSNRASPGEAGLDHRGGRRELTRNGVHYPPSASPENKRQSRRKAASHKLFKCRENLERAKGLEPSTPTLARSCSTTELHPHPKNWRRWLANNGQSYAKCRPRMQQPTQFGTSPIERRSAAKLA
jgi:hypothetical protein